MSKINKSPTAQVRKFNQAPYFDDFNETKNYVRILFRPKLSVQTRELNQLQTILQDQIGILADSLVGNKTSIVGGKPNFNKSINYIKLADGTRFSRAPQDYQDATFAAENGVSGIIRFAIPEDAGDPPTLYVSYESASPTTNEAFPKPGNIITVTFKDLNQEVITISEDKETCIGFGSAVIVEEGIFYIRKTFVRVPSQLLIVKKYGITATDPDFTIGLLIKEKIVTSEDDVTLLDNAMGYPNETAPGAHRYQMTGLLIKRDDVSEDELENFISLMRIEKNEVAQKPRDDNDTLPDILSLLARRTNDESGDYVIDTFDLDVREHLLTESNESTDQKLTITDKTGANPAQINIKTSNNGVYLLAEGGMEDHLCLQLDPGLAYVRGWEVRIDNITRLACPKARQTATIDNSIVQVTYTNSVVLEPTAGDLTLGSKLIFKSATGSPIGSAFVIGVKSILGSSQVKVYIANITFNPAQSFSQVKSVSSDGNETSLVAFSAKYISSEINNANSSYVYALPHGMAKTVLPTVHQFYKTYIVNATGTEVNLTNEDFNDIFSSDVADYYVYVQNETSGQPASLQSLSQNSVRLNISNIKNGSQNVKVKVIAKIFSSTPSIKTKKLIGDTGDYEEQHAATSLRTSNSITLNKSDGAKLIKVSGSSSGDITSKFTFDNGQRASHYDRCRLVLKPGQFVDSREMLTVVYSYYNHSSTGDFFCTDSYKDIDYTNIPYYTDTQTGVNLFLGAAIDFRPRLNANSTQLDAGRGLAVVNEQLIAKVTYYLSRMDRIMVTSAGQIVLVQGEASFRPQLPPELKDAITIYELYLSPYTFSINDAVSKKLNHKRYTMKDIGKLESRLSAVEEVALLNKLESDVANVNFGDRFKSGYIVDNFSTSDTSDIADLEFGIATDLIDPQARARTVSDFIDVDFYGAGSTSVRYHADTGIVTLDYDKVAFISQDLAASSIKIQPLISYGWGTGTVKLLPNVDIWREEWSNTTEIYRTESTGNEIVVKGTPRLVGVQQIAGATAEVNARIQELVETYSEPQVNAIVNRENTISKTSEPANKQTAKNFITGHMLKRLAATGLINQNAELSEKFKENGWNDIPDNKTVDINMTPDELRRIGDELVRRETMAAVGR